ncbi:MAG: DNA mismatch repair protein [Chloroflexi bacterium ADurb.Bin325]|nr:MAG: DNA mismatch repair protein [Chloroflexi bacterium ADurb.Bin325]
MKDIHVQAQKDHILSLCTASPIQALTELVWNALDADAFDVKVDVIQNPLGGIDAIRVSDDGQGVNALQADTHFGNLGGSWKLDAVKTPLSGRVLHGRKGKGRFKAFALGNRVEWRTTMRTADGLRSFVLAGEAQDPSHFTLADQPAPGPATGTEVLITEIRAPLGSLLDASWAVQQLASHFALYLKAYPNVRIYFQGLLVNPVIVQRASHLYHLKSSEGAKAELQVIEWKTKQSRGKIVFCNSDGFALHEVDAAVRPGSGFNYTAYLVSSRFAALHDENLLILDEMHPETKAFLDASRDILRRHFRERREALAAELLQQWQADGVYPYPGEPADEAEAAARKRFEACALTVRAYSDNFDATRVAGPNQPAGFVRRVGRA